MGLRVNTNVRLGKATAGMAMLLDTLARREMIGERAKDRALEYKKIGHEFERIRLQGKAQASGFKLAELRMELQGKQQAAQLKQEGQKINIESQLVLGRLKDQQHARKMSLLQHQLAISADERAARALSHNIANDRRKLLTEQVGHQLQFATIFDQRAQQSFAKADEASKHMISIFGTMEEGVFTPTKTYKDMFDQLISAGYGKTYADVASAILDKYHSNYQRIVAPVVEGYGASTLMDEKVPVDVRAATMADVLKETWSAPPDQFGQGAGLFYDAATGRISDKDQKKLMKSIEKEFPSTKGYTDKFRNQVFYANMIDSVKDSGEKVFTGTRNENKLSGFTDSAVVLRSARDKAELMLDRHLSQMSIVSVALPSYSISRSEFNSSVSGAHNATKEATRLNTKLKAEQQAVFMGNPDGLTPSQSRNIDSEVRTVLDSFGEDLRFSERNWIEDALSKKGIQSVMDDVGVTEPSVTEPIEGETGVEKIGRAEDIFRRTVNPYGGKGAKVDLSPGVKKDYGYGLPDAMGKAGNWLETSESSPVSKAWEKNVGNYVKDAFTYDYGSHPTGSIDKIMPNLAQQLMFEQMFNVRVAEIRDFERFREKVELKRVAKDRKKDWLEKTFDVVLPPTYKALSAVTDHLWWLKGIDKDQLIRDNQSRLNREEEARWLGDNDAPQTP